MARPKKDSRLHKTRKIDFRLDETQYSIIEKYAADAGMSVSDYVRHQAVYGKVEISYPVIAKVTDLQELTSQFAAIGNNLNQIAQKAHVLNVIDAQRYDRYARMAEDLVREITRAMIEPRKMTQEEREVLRNAEKNKRGQPSDECG